jgi:uncharacterized surface protein with fasciclin (FAS1) repeats
MLYGGSRIHITRRSLMRKQFLAFASAALVAVAFPILARAQSADIVETANAAGNLKTFSKAIVESGLAETLKGVGPFTVFAPSDDAFAKLPPGRLASLMKDKSALKEVLLYHVVTGTLTSADIEKLNGKSRKTAEGGDAKIMTSGAGIMVNNATVIKADTKASNGIIHIIDSVMMPPGS